MTEKWNWALAHDLLDIADEMESAYQAGSISFEQVSDWTRRGLAFIESAENAIQSIPDSDPKKAEKQQQWDRLRGFLDPFFSLGVIVEDGEGYSLLLPASIDLGDDL